MTTLAHNDIATPPEDVLRHTLDGVFQLCERLAVWGQKHADSGLPLTELVCNEIQSLCATSLLLRIQITGSGYVPSESFQQTLVRCKTQLSETLDLLSFHKHAERGGQEGDLNVLYARRYILNQDTHNGTHHLYGRKEGLVRLGIELKEQVAALVQDKPAESMTAGVAVQRFQHLEPRLRDFFSRVQEQLNPRYVHNYTSLADTPYVVDPNEGTSSGSYGTVRKVNHKESGEPFAMKTFREVFYPKQMKKILREIGILEGCNHKNIVRFVQAFRTDDEDDQPVHFVMAPWAPYTLSLFLHSPDVKRKARCPWFQQNSSESNRCIYQIMYGLADAVDYLHKHHIKHKDLKPDNILLYQEKSHHPTALITDVGVSKIYKPGASTNFTDSTYIYLAPEQHAKKESTFKSDVWQLGCCFAEILAVANKGQSGHEELLDSFIRDDENCQCSIAFEQPSFITTLGAICKRGNSAQKKAYAVVVGMLDLNPQDRPSIDVVKAALMKLTGVKTEAANC
ncbi:serine/threonine protein kinase [Trichoderma harzianum]|uniref:Serine/threonine protein kinase n=1 Tax=Trichoderma harzianum TaxID=5544 RepID=A0A0G0AIM2_TRIHA|nr:serine/threonine protein kinase [Trichoderma harzianum]